MKNNLYLVQVSDSYGPNKFLPLAVGYLWSYAQQDSKIVESWELKDVVYEKLPINKVVAKLDNPKLVALSCYVWTWEYNKKLAKAIKKQYPNCLIVAGGPQVSKYDIDFFTTNSEFDLAILGEGEYAFSEILKNYPTQSYHNIPHVITRKNKLAIPIRTKQLEHIPSPILTGFYDKIISQRKDKVQWQVTFETLRGCPYQCAFCDIGEDYWNKITKFDMDRIREEITWMGQNKIEYVTVCDSNWGMLPRDVEITKHVIATKLKYGFPKFWDVTWAKSNSERIFEISMLDKLAGTKLFKGITFSMQSMNKETLAATKRFNLADNTIKDSLTKYQKENISTYSELIWPMPYETLDSLQQSIQQLIDYGQKDFLMVHPLVLTKNAPMAQPNYLEKNKLEYKQVPLDIFWLEIPDADNYVTENVDAVYATNTVNFDDMVAGHMLSFWVILLYYYGWGHYIIETISKQFDMSQTEVVKSLIEYITTRRQGLLWEQHNITELGIKNVFDLGAFWGTYIDGVYWEYKSASCIIFHKNREQLAKEFADFITVKFNFTHAKELVKLNLLMCVDWQSTYPLKIEINPIVSKMVLGYDASTLIIDHWDSTITNDKEFVHKAYHYQRKNKYWQCSVRPNL
jgi:putative methyltransferase